MSVPEGESSALQVQSKGSSGNNEGGKGSPASTPERGTSPVSDDTCPICLGSITDKCVANSCMHSFCLVCLKEWAKQKAVCPLCKLNFTFIMYDIKSERQYKEWRVPRPPPERLANFQEFLDAERRRFFGYRTTNFPGAAALRRQQPIRLPRDFPPYVIPPGPRYWRSPLNSQRGTSMFRLSVYLNNVWVQPLSDVTGRYRESSPELYREQPALTHRLVPWVNRELSALLPSSRIGVVLTEVMSLIDQHPINSRSFRQAMRSHLGDRTSHFAHEFYHYARSPYDMVGHDHASQYLPHYNHLSSSSSSSSSEEDAVVEVDQEGNPVAGPMVERQETLTQEGWVVISSDASSSAPDSPAFHMADTSPDSFHQQPSSITLDRPSITATPPYFTETHNPEPPARHSRQERHKQARSGRRTINAGASTSQSDMMGASATFKREEASDEDTDECIIVEEVNKKLKMPEIINIDSEDTEVATSKACTSDGKRSSREKRKRSSCSNHKEKTSKKKPLLKRNNFLSLPGPGTSSGKKYSSQEDHSYCSEASSSRSGPIQNSSIEISLKWHNRSKLSDSVTSLKKRQNEKKRKIANISSDNESSSGVEHKKLKQKEKTKVSCNKLKLKRDRTSYNHPRSPGRDQNVGAKRMKKDHRSKIKSSARSRTNERHNLASDNEDNSAHNSDSLLTSTASGRTRSSWDDHSWNYSDESTVSHSSSHHAKTKAKKKKKKLKEKRKSTKSKKSKKSKHKKKVKAKKISSSSSSSDTDTSEVIVKRYKKKSKVVEDSSSSSWSDW